MLFSFSGWWVYQSNGKNNSNKNNLILKHKLQFCSVSGQYIASHESSLWIRGSLEA